MPFSMLLVVHEMRKSVIIKYLNNRVFAKCDDLVRLLMLSRNCLPSFTLSLPLISDLMIILTYGDGKMLGPTFSWEGSDSGICDVSLLGIPAAVELLGLCKA